MMINLPKWCITDVHPAIYDIESATAIEMTAKLYGKMSELVDDYNAFVERINEASKAFENSMKKDYDAFTVAMRQEFQDFIDDIDLKYKNQNEVINDAVNYMKLNIKSACLDAVEKYMNENSLEFVLEYNENNEELVLRFGGVPNA